MNWTRSSSSPWTTMMPPRAATFSMARWIRPKSMRLPARLGCGGRTLVVKTAGGKPAAMASGIAGSAQAAPASVM
jgi:hypothetical protein